MKKQIFALLALLCALVLALPAPAETQADFESRCDIVLTADTVLYTQSGGDMTATDTLSEGMPCVHLGNLMDWECIQYMENGAVRVGWIKAGQTRVTTANRPSSTPTPRPLSRAEILGHYGLSEKDEIVILALGTAESRISANGVETTVPTWILVSDSSLPENERICVATAPRTGKITLLEGASAKSKTLCSIPGGKIMKVLETGEEFTMVEYNGQTGYVRNTSITLTGKRNLIGHGTVHVKNNTDGSKTVKGRLKASADGVSSFSWRTGTCLTLLSKDGDWYEAEADGFIGYISASYVTDITED